MKGLTIVKLSKIWDFFEAMGRKAVSRILKPFGKRVTDGMWTAIMQFVKFGLVGAMNTVVDYLTYLITLFIFTKLNWFGEKAYLISTVLGFIVSFFNMFYWNNKYVFKEKEGEKRSVLRSLIKLFLSYSVTGILIRPTLMYLLVDIIGCPKAIAPIPIMLITIPINFLLSKLWAFKGKKVNE